MNFDSSIASNCKTTPFQIRLGGKYPYSSPVLFATSYLVIFLFIIFSFSLPPYLSSLYPFIPLPFFSNPILLYFQLFFMLFRLNFFSLFFCFLLFTLFLFCFISFIFHFSSSFSRYFLCPNYSFSRWFLLSFCFLSLFIFICYLLFFFRSFLSDFLVFFFSYFISQHFYFFSYLPSRLGL